MQNIETRIKRLERQNRLWRNLFILAGLAVLALVTWEGTKPIPDVIRARGFEVVRHNGTTVGSFGAWLGGGWLNIYPLKPKPGG